MLLVDQGREMWANFIISRERAWRLLYARGDIWYEHIKFDDPARVESIISSLTGRTDDLSLLSLFHYLSQTRLHDFFDFSVNELLRAASRVTSPKNITVHGVPKGKIDWSSTIRMRRSGLLPQTSFKSRQPNSSYDIPENRLLKLFFFNIVRAVDRLIAEVGTQAMAGEMLELRGNANDALSRSWLRSVELVNRSTSNMYKRAKRSRNWRYGHVAELQLEYQRVIFESRWQSILALLSKGWLSPIKDDDLFELYSLITIMEFLQNQLGFGPPTEVSLIRRGRREIAIFHRDFDGMIAKVYFDQSPATIFNHYSFYENVLDHYFDGIKSTRRPDICVRLIPVQGNETRILFECKKSQDDSYARDSIYKSIGYLKDFEFVWEQHPEQTPKIAVIFPQGASLKNVDHAQTKNLALALLHIEDALHLEQIFSSTQNTA